MSHPLSEEEVSVETNKTIPPSDCSGEERGNCREHCAVTHWTGQLRGHTKPHWMCVGGKSIAYLRPRQAGHGGRTLTLPSPSSPGSLINFTAKEKCRVLGSRSNYSVFVHLGEDGLTGSYCVALAGLELTMQTRLASNSESSFCLCLLSPEHYIWLIHLIIHHLLRFNSYLPNFFSFLFIQTGKSQKDWWHSSRTTFLIITHIKHTPQVQNYYIYLK